MLHSVAIVGFGCAGFHCLKTLRELDETLQIDVYSDGVDAPENPMLTTYFAAGKLHAQEVYPFGTLEELRKTYRFRFLAGVSVTQVHDGCLVTADGVEHRYDKILIATGAKPIVPPIPLQGDGIFTIRTYADARRLSSALAGGGLRQSVVVGASMAGIKVVELLAQNGVSCTLADRATQLFPTACLEPMARIMEERLRGHGIALSLGKSLCAISETGQGLSVSFDDGSVPCDAAVLCVGTRVDLSLVDPAEIQTDRGILVNRQMQTSAPNVYAAGDCCQGYDLQSDCNRLIGLWANAAKQGICAAQNMLGRHTTFDGEILCNITHFFDMNFTSIGNIGSGGTLHTYENPERGFTIMALVEDGRINALNLLELYPLSGMIRHHMVKSFLRDEAPNTDYMNAAMARAGIPTEFISLLGGEKRG